VCRADNFAIFVCRLSRNSGASNLLESHGPVQICNGISLPLLQYGGGRGDADIHVIFCGM
jgi:hypothetical protein